MADFNDTQRRPSCTECRKSHTPVASWKEAVARDALEWAPYVLMCQGRKENAQQYTNKERWKDRDMW